MTAARVSLGLAALLLLATAAFHASGSPMVAGWLTGSRGAMLRVLWYVPTLDWAAVALLWVWAAMRPSRPLVPLVAIGALVPFGAAALLASAVGPGFPGIWMLAGAGALALVGAARLRAPHKV